MPKQSRSRTPNVAAGRAPAAGRAGAAATPRRPRARTKIAALPASSTADRRPAAPYRVVIENLQPLVDGGRHAVKRTVGDTLRVTADVFCDGHDVVRAHLMHRPAGAREWAAVPMEPLPNDAWQASFTLAGPGFHEFTVQAWSDPFATWRRDLERRVAARQDVRSELLEGAAMVRAASHRARGTERAWLESETRLLESDAPGHERATLALDPELLEVMSKHGARPHPVEYDGLGRVWADRERARFGAWYEFFPRSAGPDPSRSATFAEAAARLPEIAAMGFDVVYLPPIHPIGRTFRKGPNNTLDPGPGDPGSPWAIGAAEGGHKAVHPELGTLEDFDAFVRATKKLGMEVALDLAFQCSPDHPYAREHPEWFRHRPDGTIKYAENPPKKYQDIYPFDFECEAWRELWAELLGVVLFWVRRGVRILRVDNPHTKPFRFWAWLIAEVQSEHPDVLFLSEAFTRPKVMKHLAKAGFTQSYSYFTWRNSAADLAEYLTELTQTPVREYLRPNLFANTPDILHEYLQVGGRAAFQVRLVLAATLGANYGIYGPAFELCEGRAVPGSEEYLDSEKYQLRAWNHEAPGHLRGLIARVNRARRANPALQHDHGLRFHPVDNERLLAYSKSAPDGGNVVLAVANVDYARVQDGWVTLDLEALGIGADETFQVHDVIDDARYLWKGPRNYVRLDPAVCPAHLFVIRRRVGTERDFDYYQ